MYCIILKTHILFLQATYVFICQYTVELRSEVETSSEVSEIEINDESTKYRNIVMLNLMRNLEHKTGEAVSKLNSGKYFSSLSEGSH